MDWMAREWHEGRPAVLGISLGTAVAVELAAARPVAALVLDAPFTSLPDAVLASRGIWLPGFLYRSVFDSLSSIRSVGAPVLVMHGEDDGLVPPSRGRALYAAAPCKAGSLFLPSVGHTVLESRVPGGAGALAAVMEGVASGTLRCKE